MPTDPQNDTTFYIVDEELALLPAHIRTKWANRLQKETLTAYETPEQIDARMKSVNYAQYPNLKKKIDLYAGEIKAGRTPEMSFEDFPEEALGSFLYSIGASGISFYIHVYLSDKDLCESEELLEAVAALSRTRHRILEKNAAVFAYF